MNFEIHCEQSKQSQNEEYINANSPISQRIVFDIEVITLSYRKNQKGILRQPYITQYFQKFVFAEKIQVVSEKIEY